MIHDIIIYIWEDHVFEQEMLIICNNTIVKGLIIDAELMDIIICVMTGVYTLFPILASFGHGDLNFNKVGGIFFSNIW